MLIFLESINFNYQIIVSRLRYKQNKYPVLLLTQGVNTKYEQYLDQRTHNINNGSNFATTADILGKYWVNSKRRSFCCWLYETSLSIRVRIYEYIFIPERFECNGRGHSLNMFYIFLTFVDVVLSEFVFRGGEQEQALIWRDLFRGTSSSLSSISSSSSFSSTKNILCFVSFALFSSILDMKNKAVVNDHTIWFRIEK